jgi:NAD(P)-dependent dehydrogenase (short-subunit alcohol dehydrogenase family)
MNIRSQSPRTVVITGGSHGIGRAIARAFLAAGDNVVFTFKEGDQRARELETLHPGRAFALRADLGDPASVEVALATLALSHPVVDVLVNNVGVVQPASFETLNQASWARTFQVNLFAPFRLIQGVVPLMARAESPAIVNISSMRGERGQGSLDAIDYSSSKAALTHLGETLAKILAPRVTVNTIAPGFVATESVGALPPDMTDAAVARSLSRRLISMDEIAGACVFLCSPSARSVRGQTLLVDGGYTLGCT